MDGNEETWIRVARSRIARGRDTKCRVGRAGMVPARLVGEWVLTFAAVVALPVAIPRVTLEVRLAGMPLSWAGLKRQKALAGRVLQVKAMVPEVVPRGVAARE
jgi:hypothetical protein